MKVVLRVLTAIIILGIAVLIVLDQSMRPASLPGGCDRTTPYGNQHVLCAGVDLERLEATGAAPEIAQLTFNGGSLGDSMAAFENLAVLTVGHLPDDKTFDAVHSAPQLIQLNILNPHEPIDVKVRSVAIGFAPQEETQPATLSANADIQRLSLKQPAVIPAAAAERIEFLKITEPLSGTMDLRPYSSLTTFDLTLNPGAEVILPSHLSEDDSVERKTKSGITRLFKLG